MRRPKKTGWFPAHIKPVRVGWYETRNPFDYAKVSDFRWWWDGVRWTHGPGQAYTTFQNRTWRGLASDPAVAK